MNRVYKKTEMLLCCTLLGVFAGGVGAQEGVVGQWALAVVDYHPSAIGGTAGNEIQTLGEPNTACESAPVQGYDGLSWRGGTQPDSGLGWIELRYEKAVYATSIAIHQSLNPGAVTSVLVRGTGGEYKEVWAGKDTTIGCPGVLEIDFPSLSFPTSVVRIELDVGLVPGWNQIDAVRLVGFPVEGVESFYARVEGDRIESPSSFGSFTFADYDNDGWPDMLGTDITNAADLDVTPLFTLLHNEGDGTFSDRSSLLPVRERISNAGRVFGDYDNDGDQDLYLSVGSIGRSTKGRDILLRNDGGSFTEVTLDANLSDSLISASAIWWDYDLDGTLDLYVGRGDFNGNNDAPNSLYRNNGDGTFTETTNEANLAVQFNPPESPYSEGTFAGMRAADLNGDGWVDLYVPVGLGANRLFLNDGQGRFLDVTSGDLADSGDAVGATVGDINNDGDLDIFQASPQLPGSGARYRSFMLLNTGDGHFLDVTAGIGLSTLEYIGLIYSKLYDFDNDGDLDLSTGFPFVFFVNKGDGTYEDRTFQAGLGGTYSIGDHDGDGFLDVWFNDSLFRNKGNGNHWLRVELAGSVSNRNGIGAQVIATSDDLEQTREIYGGDGYFQGEILAHFGIGDNISVDQLEIRWPSGQVDILSNVPADQTIRVIEGRGEYYPAEKTVWEVDPPASLQYGQEIDFIAVAKPALFEPTAEIIRVTGDLSSLGGPEAIPLEDLGDGTYKLEASFVVGGRSELRDVEVFIEQETSLGPHWINLSRNIEVLEDPNTAVTEDYSGVLPSSILLHQNYPNPFNSGTVVRFDLPTSADVNLAIFNLTGQQVATLVDGTRKAGTYTVHWDGRDDGDRELASGVYLYRLLAGDQPIETRKLLLVR